MSPEVMADAESWLVEKGYESVRWQSPDDRLRRRIMKSPTTEIPDLSDAAFDFHLYVDVVRGPEGRLVVSGNLNARPWVCFALSFIRPRKLGVWFYSMNESTLERGLDFQWQYRQRAGFLMSVARVTRWSLASPEWLATTLEDTILEAKRVRRRFEHMIRTGAVLG